MDNSKLKAKPCSRTLQTDDIEKFKALISQGYKYRLYIDGLPNAVLKRDPITGSIHPKYDEGVPVGKVVRDDEDGKLKYALYNHWIITVKTQPVENSKRINADYTVGRKVLSVKSRNIREVEGPYDGPYEITEVCTNDTVRIQRGTTNGRINIRRLHAYFER